MHDIDLSVRVIPSFLSLIVSPLKYRTDKYNGVILSPNIKQDTLSSSNETTPIIKTRCMMKIFYTYKHKRLFQYKYTILPGDRALNAIFVRLVLLLLLILSIELTLFFLLLFPRPPDRPKKSEIGTYFFSNGLIYLTPEGRTKRNKMGTYPAF